MGGRGSRFLPHIMGISLAVMMLGGLGLAAFLWSLKSGQYEDLDGAAWRALEDRAPGDERAETSAAKQRSPGQVGRSGGPGLDHED